MPYVSADLICLDPPFNSNRGYNIFFASTKGDSSAATLGIAVHLVTFR
ncbi:MAG: hypothetical protein IJD04_06070 [Desulfovibrionaceae bacterium]|nr:hypothetical protein [Desulfovibrionaceae bacterium]